jgi:hypothetical protein
MVITVIPTTNKVFIVTATQVVIVITTQKDMQNLRRTLFPSVSGWGPPLGQAAKAGQSCGRVST